ncbi:zinc finger protein 853-like [Periplaneta americana]|uniref:zinc finger protein 853-like n=1 Tax=Periplaneta americana TaxID=6978 RepID=UPI0037E77BB9
MVRKMLKYCSVDGCPGSSRSDPELRFFFFPRNPLRAQLWAEKLGMPCSVEEARPLCRKVVCSRHFSDTDFTTNKRTRLNWTAVPSLHDSVLDLILKPEPSFSSISLPESPVPTVLDSEDELRVLVPTNTYAKTSICPPTFIPILVPEHTDNYSPSLAVPKKEPSQPSDDTLSLKDPLSPQVPMRDSNCGRESEGVSLSRSCRSNLETVLKKMEEQLQIERRLRLKLEGQLLREQQQWMQPKSEFENKKQCCSELETQLQIEKQQRNELQAQLEIEKQQKNELQAQLRKEQQQRNELQAQLRIEQQQRNELQAQLEIEKQQKNELQAQLEIDKQQKK